nr:TetR family transcriptional regulator [Pantoea stewartii]
MVNDEGRSLRAKSEMTKGRILETASEIIRHDGLHACTQRTIANELDMSPGTITWHFRILDDLHDAVIRNAVESFRIQTLKWFSDNAGDRPEAQLTHFLFYTLQQDKRQLERL